ncbi:hypothetical protein HUG17_0334 [Dermatophagoides farinae]|uniref:Uncharacterized protein n=1 Tax=Dermatophagoides farinae TaxID=6954 RepID=A0A9D4SKK7_DERFA|nr:hypothetical protein HUG17_0334 [Dermatophagoides farinae]
MGGELLRSEGDINQHIITIETMERILKLTILMSMITIVIGQFMVVKIKVLNPIGENSDLIEDFWTQMSLERKFHTEVIEIFQRQCVDKMILKEKRMINYVTVMGIKSVLDNRSYRSRSSVGTFRNETLYRKVEPDNN